LLNFWTGHGVTRLFKLSGGAIAHLLDSAGGRYNIRCVSMHHEQAAAFAAEGWAGNGIGVALATRGPGALNLLTGSAAVISTPFRVFLTGQVNSYEYKFDRPVRQIGFQETDIGSCGWKAGLRFNPVEVHEQTDRGSAICGKKPKTRVVADPGSVIW